jgi:hypothetical protein
MPSNHRNDPSAAFLLVLFAAPAAHNPARNLHF